MNIGQKAQYYVLNADGITRVKKTQSIFFYLEKRHFKNGVISQLKTGENEFIMSDKEILHQCENFYRDLYKSRISEQQSEPSNFNFFEDTNILDADEKESL